MIRVAIVARDAHAAEEMAEILAADDLFEVVNVRVSPRLLPSSLTPPCDVLLTVGLRGFETPSDGPPVVALVDSQAPVLLRMHSPHAVLPLSARAEEISAALMAAAHGLFVLTPDQALGSSRSPSLGSARRPATARRPELEAATFGVKPEKLTARELEVLRMIADGLANKAIAAALGVSDHTVKFHVSQILAKLNATSRTEAVTAGIRAGLLFL